MPVRPASTVRDEKSITRTIGDRLRDLYEPSINEPMPARVLHLLRQAEENLAGHDADQDIVTRRK